MAISADEELRLKCLELAIQGRERGVIMRARSYYLFAKGDRRAEDEKPKIAPPYTQEGEAKRIMNMVRPT